MACFPNSGGILLYRFVTSNVAMSVCDLIFSGMEFPNKLGKQAISFWIDKYPDTLNSKF